jgi:hypothetical protein
MPPPEMRRAALGGSGPKSQKSDRTSALEFIETTAHVQDLQVRKLRRLFSFPLAMAETVAELAYSTEGRR